MLLRPEAELPGTGRPGWHSLLLSPQLRFQAGLPAGAGATLVTRQEAKVKRKVQTEDIDFFPQLQPLCPGKQLVMLCWERGSNVDLEIRII